MRVPMLVVALIATPLLASVSNAQARSAEGNRHSEEQQKGKHVEKNHDDKKCEKSSKSNNNNQNQQGQHEDSDNDRGSKKCADTPTPPVTPPVTPPPAAGTMEVHGMAFSDLNGNGVYDSADLPLPNWSIQLSGPASATATTGSDGTYIIAGLQPGVYLVCAAGGLTQTAPSTGPSCASGSPGYSVDFPASMPGLWYSDIDFALK